jgi:glutaconate CoA-transferase, subunit A
MPLRGLIGSDLLAARPEWLVIDNPFAAAGPDGSPTAGDPIVLLPALRPDVALFHAPMADRAGNVWIGRRRELMTMAHASVKTVVTVERLYDGDLLDDPALAAGVLPGLYVDRVAVAPRGAWPLAFHDEYAADLPHLRDYIRDAATEDGFRLYLARHVLEHSEAA